VGEKNEPFLCVCLRRKGVRVSEECGGREIGFIELREEGTDKEVMALHYHCIRVID